MNNFEVIRLLNTMIDEVREVSIKSKTNAFLVIDKTGQ